MVFVYALIPAIIWGVSFIATKYAVREVLPSTLGFIRFVIAYIVLQILVSIKKIDEKIPFKDKVTFFLMGFTGITLYFVGENYGLQYTSSSNGSLIVSTIPIFTLLADRIMHRKTLSPFVTIGVIISFIGIYLLIFGFSFVKNVNVKGDLVMFVPVFAWVVYTYISKMRKASYSTILITKEMTFYGAILFLPFMLFEFKKGVCPLSISLMSWVSILYLGIVCSAFAYVLWNKALQMYDEKVVNSFIYTIPVFTIIFELILLREPPKPMVYISTAFVIAGLFLTHRYSK